MGGGFVGDVGRFFEFLFDKLLLLVKLALGAKTLDVGGGGLSELGGLSTLVVGGWSELASLQTVVVTIPMGSP